MSKNTIKCPSCGKEISETNFDTNFGVCPNCGFYFRIPAKKKIKYFFDFWEENIPYRKTLEDPLHFRDKISYTERLKSLREKLDISESVITGTAKINNREFVSGIFDFDFLGGTLGINAGEKLYSLFNYAQEHKTTIILFITSGGARMQEGLFSLMQMQKVTIGISKIKKEKIPYITVLSDPTTGGVMATVASQGDIIIAEKGASIGFTGKRVIKKLSNKKIPENFQKAEQVQKEGFIDIVVERKNMKETLYRVLSYT